jgi:hypothetical protein
VPESGYASIRSGLPAAAKNRRFSVYGRRAFLKSMRIFEAVTFLRHHRALHGFFPVAACPGFLCFQMCSMSGQNSPTALARMPKPA